MFKLNPSSVRKMNKSAITTMAQATGQRREVVESDVRELWAALINAGQAKRTLTTLNDKYNKLIQDASSDKLSDDRYGVKCLSACFTVVNITDDTDLLQK